MQGIETDYKRVMHAKREIPASSCPSSIENMMYATGVSTGLALEEEEEAFNDLLDRLDARAEVYEQPKVKKKYPETMFHKRQRIGICGGEWCRVDTDGCFRHGNNMYRVNDNEVQYQPVSTEYGDLYDMDKILVSGGKFYDMNLDEVEASAIGGWITMG